MAVDAAAIAGAGDGADELTLNLFADVTVAAVKDRFERRDGRHSVWYGKVAGDPLSMVVLAVGDGLVHGTVFANRRTYAIRGADAQTQVVEEIERAAFPKEPGIQPRSNAFAPPSSRAAAAPGAAADAAAAAAADDGSVFDVLVVYTPAARTVAGGTSAVENQIDLAVAQTNQVYLNSGVSTRVNLVHAAEVAYVESGDWYRDLARLADTTDLHLRDVHTLRDAYQADVVVLVMSNALFCGLADAIMATAATAFSIVDISCLGWEYTFGHELGHLQGARHDWYADPTEDANFPYNHGHISLSERMRTIMSYDDLCFATPPGTKCTVVPYFSDPAGFYPDTSTPDGSPTENNRLVLNTTKTTVANFRPRQYTLTVSSTFPASGVPVDVSSTDFSGQVTSGWTRVYPGNSVVTLTAPATAGSNGFAGWSGCSLTSGAGGTVCSVTVDGLKTVTANYETWRTGETDLGGGWKTLDWFGTYYIALDPWVYHAQHGFLYPVEGGGGAAYFWDAGLQEFWWTSSGWYPYLYRFGADLSWFWYLRDSVSPRWFHDFSSGQWEAVP